MPRTDSGAQVCAQDRLGNRSLDLLLGICMGIDLFFSCMLLIKQSPGHSLVSQRPPRRNNNSYFQEEAIPAELPA